MPQDHSAQRQQMYTPLFGKAMEADLESYLAKRDVELERFVMEKALLSQAGPDLQERTKEARKVSEQRKSGDERALRKLTADIEEIDPSLVDLDSLD